MSNIQVFKITGVCTFEGAEEDAPCMCYPELCVECLQDECVYFVMYDGEIDEADLEE